MKWITLQAARKRLNGAVSASSLYRLAHSGAVKASRIAGRIVVCSDSLDAYVTAKGFEVITAPPRRKARPAS